MKRLYRIAITWIVLILIGCTPSERLFDYSFNYLDKSGLFCGYEFQYSYHSPKDLTEIQKEQIISISADVVRSKSKFIGLTVFLNKRDSIESVIIKEISQEIENEGISMSQIEILNLLLPQQIIDALMKRDGKINRIKPV